LLQTIGRQELIQHTALISEINKISTNDSNEALLYYSEILELLYTLKRYLAANVAPNAVLEQVIYNI
jgi:hypothetical protein